MEGNSKTSPEHVRTYYRNQGIHENVKELNPDQRLYQTFYAYNSGEREMSSSGVWRTYWVWDTINQKWIVNPNANPDVKNMQIK